LLASNDNLILITNTKTRETDRRYRLRCQFGKAPRRCWVEIWI